MSKNDHMLAILWMLNSGAKLTAKHIADKLEINIRTVYRYMDALSASGVPMISESGHNGGYSLLKQFISAPLIFNMEEKKALLHAAVFAKEAGYAGSESLGHAISKLKKYSNQEQESILQRQLAGFDVIHGKPSSSIQPVLVELEQAIDQEYSIEVDYRTSRDEQPKNRIIDPYGTVFWNQKWYTVGFCHLRNEIRIFRVERIIHIERMTMSFQRPESFSPREYFMQRLMPELAGENEGVSVIIEGRPDALDDLCLHWYLGHYLKERTPNQATFLLEAPVVLEQVPSFLLPYGKSLQVIEPHPLKQKLVAVASDLLEYYQRE